MSYQRVLNRLPEKDRTKVENNPELQELIKDAERVFDRTNKRIRNIESHTEIRSPALESLKEKKGDVPRFGTSDSYSNLSEYVKEYARAQNFDTLETSTVKGAQNFTKNMKNEIKKNLNIEEDKEPDNDFVANLFDILHGVHERMPDKLYKNQLKYEEYLENVIQGAEFIDYSKLDTRGIEQAVSGMVNKLTDDIKQKQKADTDEIERMSKGTGRLF